MEQWFQKSSSYYATKKTGHRGKENMYRFSPSPADSFAILSGDNCTLASKPTKYAGTTSNGSDGKRWKCAYY
jgi:hypothetical protein